MVLTRENQPFHTRSRGGAGNLFGIEVSRVKERRRFIAVTPFFIGEGVDGEMDESVKLHFMPTKLPV